MANRKISDLPLILGTDLAGNDLFTVVRTDEVDPTIKNKKLTVSGLENFLNTLYFSVTGGTISGDLTVTQTISGTTVTGTTASFTTGIFNSLVTSGTTHSGNLNVSGNLFVDGSGYFHSGISVTGTISGITVTGTTANFTDGNFITSTIGTGSFTNITGVTIVGTTTVSGATVTGDAGEFDTLTGNTAGFTSITGTTVTGTTGIFQNLITSGHTVTGSMTVSGDLTVTGTISGNTITGTNGVFTNITGQTISGDTITGTNAQFTNITGTTVIGTTTVSGATVTGDTGSFDTLNANTAYFVTGIIKERLTVTGDSYFHEDIFVTGSGIFGSGLFVTGVSSVISGTTITGATGNFGTLSVTGLDVPDLTVTGTISGAIITGDVGRFTTLTGATIVGTTSISGAAITGTTIVGTTTVSGATVTGDTGNFGTGNFVLAQGSTVSGNTITGRNIYALSSITGSTIQGATVSGTTVTGDTGSFGILNVTGLSVPNLTVTGTISGAIITGDVGRFTTLTGDTIVGTTSISGETVTGTDAQFTNITGATIIGTTTVSGLTVTGDTGNFGTGNIVLLSGSTARFSTEVSGRNIYAQSTITGNTIEGTTISGVTVTGNTGNFGTLTATGLDVSDLTVTGTISGAIITGDVGRFTTLTGSTIVGTTSISGLTVTGNTGNFGTGDFVLAEGSTVTGATGNFAEGGYGYMVVSNARSPYAGVGGILIMEGAALDFYASGTADSVGFIASQSTAVGNLRWTLPTADATVSGHALVSDAAGTLSWASAGGGGGGSLSGITDSSPLIITALGENAAISGSGNATSTGVRATGTVAVGYNAFHSLTGGINNIAIGTNAAASLVNTHVSAGSGIFQSNIFIGDSVFNHITGAKVWNGYEELQRNIGIGSGCFTTGLPIVWDHDSYYSNSDNICIGAYAGGDLLSGQNYRVICIGYAAGRHIVTGNDGVFIGAYQMGGTGGYTIEAYNSVAIGSYIVTGNTAWAFNGSVAVGHYVYSNLNSYANACVGVGYSVGRYLKAASANTLVGSYHLDNSSNINNATYTTCVGYKIARQASGDTSYSTLIGNDVGNCISGSLRDVFIGYDIVGKSDRTFESQDNIFIGNKIASGTYGQVDKIHSNVCIGQNVLHGNASGVVFIGQNAGQSWDYDYSQAKTVLIGQYAASGLTSGIGNTVVGARAATALVTFASANTMIGSDAGNSVTTGTNNTCIGYDSDTATATSSDSVTLGDGYITSLRCNVTTISSLSDERDKTNILDLDQGWEFIKRLRPVKFDWARRNDTRGDYTGKKEYGFIAQELQALENEFNIKEYTQLVLDDNPDKLEAAPMRTYPILVQAVKELITRLEAAEQKITQLQNA